MLSFLSFPLIFLVNMKSSVGDPLLNDFCPPIALPAFRKPRNYSKDGVFPKE